MGALSHRVQLTPDDSNAITAYFLGSPREDKIVLWDGKMPADAQEFVIEVPVPPGMDAWVLSNGKKILVQFSEKLPTEAAPLPMINYQAGTAAGEKNRGDIIRLAKLRENIAGVAPCHRFFVIPSQREQFVRNLCLRARRAALPAQLAGIRLMLDFCVPSWEIDATAEDVALLYPLNNNSPLGKWRAEVLNRDGWRCRACACGNGERKLQAHHIKTRREHPSLALDIDNGVTLCTACHSKQHRNMAAQLWR